MPKISKYNGGYVIISLNDEDIYEKIERNLYKPILLTDIVINGIEKNDVFTTAYVEGTNIVFKDIYDKDITISDDNSVTIGDNGKHLYRYIFYFSDCITECLCNKPFSRLNTEIIAISVNKTTELTPSECKEIIDNLQSYVSNGDLPVLYTCDILSTPYLYLGSTLLNEVVKLENNVDYLNWTINSDGNVSINNTDDDLKFKCVKIF